MSSAPLFPESQTRRASHRREEISTATFAVFASVVLLSYGTAIMWLFQVVAQAADLYHSHLAVQFACGLAVSAMLFLVPLGMHEWARRARKRGIRC